MARCAYTGILAVASFLLTSSRPAPDFAFAERHGNLLLVCTAREPADSFELWGSSAQWITTDLGKAPGDTLLATAPGGRVGLLWFHPSALQGHTLLAVVSRYDNQMPGTLDCRRVLTGQPWGRSPLRRFGFWFVTLATLLLGLMASGRQRRISPRLAWHRMKTTLD